MASKRKWLTLEEKVQVIDEFEKTKMSHRQLAEKFAVGKTQIATILKDKEGIYKSWRENGFSEKSKKRLKTEAFEIDSVLYDWYCAARQKKIPVSGPILQEKALEIAKNLGCSEEFKASNGWLHRFKTRHNLCSKILCGESADVPAIVAEDWKKKVAGFCEAYAQRDIFNCDETGLFYRALPNRTLCLKKEKCYGGKKAKQRLTVLLCANLVGEFEEPLIIGKSLRPRCFKGVHLENLKIFWKANRNAWMNTEIMTEWLDKFNRKMKRQKRKVLLFLDNATCHPQLELSNVQLIFLPPNTSSVCQPLDLGVIQNFKMLYKKKLLRHVISKIDSIEDATQGVQVSVLDAIFWIISSINSIRADTVKRCFFHAGFASETQADSDDMEDTSRLQEIQNLVEILSKDVNAEEYLTLDEDLPTSNVDTDIQTIIASRVKKQEDVSEEDDDDDDEQEENVPSLTHLEALNLLKQVEHFCQTESYTNSLLHLKNVKEELEKQFVLKRRFALQKKISDYFRAETKNK